MLNLKYEAEYLRQSVVKWDSISIDTQIEKCNQELSEGAQVKRYIDRKSGKDTNRPGFQALMDDIKSGLISRVIVYKLDRISRSLNDFSNMMEVFKKYNVEFVSVNEKFDTATPMGQAMLQIVMVFAELERKTIQQRVLDNFYARGKEGRYLGGKPPYGFEKQPFLMNGKKTYQYVERHDESDLVKEIFNRYSGDINESFGSISKWINEEDIYKTARGNGWSSNTIARVIRNPAYTFATAEVCLYLKEKGCIMNNPIEDFTGDFGMYKYTEGGKERKKDEDNPANTYVTIAPHTPFIPADIWLACNRKADGNKQIKNTGKGTYSWLSGLMKCGYCGLAQTVANRQNGIHKLNCGGKKRHSCKGISTEITVPMVENYVAPLLLEHLNKQLVKSLSANAVVDNNNSREINDLNIQLIKINEEIENLVNAVATSGATAAKVYNDRIEKLDRSREKIENKILTLKSNEVAILSSEKLQECINSWDSYPFEKKKEIAKLFIKVITITDNELQIIFN